MNANVASNGERRLWLTAGFLLIGYIVMTFAGVTQEHSLMLGDKTSAASSALVHSSMARNFTGGYLEFLATLVFLVGALLVARLLRGNGAAADWMTSCISASAIVYAAITIGVGFAAGAAAVYDGHHGASLATVTTVNDIRNFGFFLSGGLTGVFALSVAAAAWTTGKLPRWVSYSGIVVGVLSIVSIPAARTGFINVSTILGLAWIVGLGIAALRESRRTAATVGSQPMAAAAV